MASPYTISAGDLRHRLAIQSYSEARDAVGGITKTWTTAITVWGSVRPMSGNELAIAKQIDERVTHKIVIRHYSSLDTTYRITHDSRTFNIVNILNLQERDKMQVITAIEEGLVG